MVQHTKLPGINLEFPRGDQQLTPKTNSYADSVGEASASSAPPIYPNNNNNNNDNYPILNQPNPILIQQPQYKAKKLYPLRAQRHYPIGNNEEDHEYYMSNLGTFLDDIPWEPKPSTVPHDEDDVMEDMLSPEPIPIIHEPEPLANIFMNHPHYNTNNPRYQEAMALFIKQQPYKSLSIKEPTTINIPMNTVEVPIISPEDPDNPRTIIAAADSQSDIEAIGFNQMIYYKQRNQIRTDRRGITICTGNGRVHVNNYVPIIVIGKNGVRHNHKFWCLESLPTYDFLLGKHLLHKLGWEYTNRYETWEHKPTNYDHIESELDTLPGTNYPWKGEPKLDVDSIEIDNPDLRPFLKYQLKQYSEVIAKHEWDSGRLINMPPFTIDLIEEDHPYKEGFLAKEYWANAHDKKEMIRQIKGMEDFELIEQIEDNAKYVSPIFPISKKTGDVRIVFDYRKLNEITQRQMWTIPEPDKLLTKFKDKKWITSLDLKGGYWHIPIKESDRHKTAFVFNNNIYQWKVMPFGPKNAPMFFQRCMDRIFGHLSFVTVYLDDISIMSETLQQHKEHLKVIFDLLKDYNIKLRLDKCRWGVTETEYLGFIVDKYGTKCKASYIKKIMDVPVPTSKTGLKRYLGLVQFLHKYVPQMHKPVAILTDLLKKERTNTIHWNEIQLTAFHELKSMIQSVKPLAHPDVHRPFHVFADASKYGIGGMLAQEDIDGDMQPVAYCSKVFSSTQTRWHVSEQEIYAAIYCTEKWSDLLRHKKFTLHTDHKNLQKLFNNAVNFKSGKLFRWAVRLQDYHFQCKYVKRSDNVVADYLSRESVATQFKPQYKSVKEFYQTSDESNPIREQLSEYGGIDIHKMYLNHFCTAIVSDNLTTTYYHTNDPFLEAYIDPYEPDENYQISEESHKFLNISYKDHVKIAADQNVLPLSISNLDDFNYVDPNRNYNQPPPPKKPPKRQRYPDPPKPPPPSKEEASEMSEVSSISCDTNKLIEQLCAMPAPDPYKRPTKPLLPALKPNVRRSPRLAKKIKKRPQNIPLKVNQMEPYTNRYLRRRGNHGRRHRLLQLHKQQNQKILNEKPYLHTWNTDLLINTKYYIPIQDDYSPVFDSTNHVKINLLRTKQCFDPICFAIINFIDTGNKALIEDLPEYIQRYVLSGRFYLNTSKILCYRHKTQTQIETQVAPASLLASILRKAHTEFHHGVSKMIHKITNEMGYWWPKMQKHIAVYCRGCNTCQHIKAGVWRSYKRGQMKLFAATKPFEQISTDIVGPLPISHSGNRYIVTMIDKFSRYCMLVPVQDISSLSVVKAIDKWITTFGPPKSILSDNGPQFISSIYRDYMKNHKNIKYKYTSTYYPQCNGQIERLHRWIKERLTLIAYDGALNFVEGEDDWSDYLSIIQYTYNSTPNKITSYAPMEIILGKNDYKLNEYEFSPDHPKAYIKFLSDRQRIIKMNARNKAKLYDEARRKSYNKKRNTESAQHEVGQRVLWNINSQYTGNRRKLGPKWVGPYEITDIWNNYQSFKLRVIPMAPIQNKSNPMNPIKIPRNVKTIKSQRNHQNIQEFVVPRAQIKPYYKSYEEQFDGTQSPMSILINTITKTIHRNPIDRHNVQLYQCLFHLYGQQKQMGYSLK